MSLTLQLSGVSKRFSRRPIFEPVTATIGAGEITAITGKNGSGKSTLLKIIAQVLPQSTGECIWTANEGKLDPEIVRKRIGYVAPYLELYGELTAVEHVQFIHSLHGRTLEASYAQRVLEETGLLTRAITSERPVRAFSSGMRQRVKLAMATSMNPEILLLDEATSNLDEEGILLVTDVVRSAADRGATVILATNEEREVALASQVIALQPYAAKN